MGRGKNGDSFSFLSFLFFSFLFFGLPTLYFYYISPFSHFYCILILHCLRGLVGLLWC